MYLVSVFYFLYVITFLIHLDSGNNNSENREASSNYTFSSSHCTYVAALLSTLISVCSYESSSLRH